MGRRQPVIRYWLEQTALLPLIREDSRQWFSLLPPYHISHKGTTGLHSDTVMYDREYDAFHIGEIGGL